MEWWLFVILAMSRQTNGNHTAQMTATGIVALFSGLSAASSGANGSVSGLLNMLSAMRYVFVVSMCIVHHPNIYSDSFSVSG